MFGKNKGDKSYVKKRAVQYGISSLFQYNKNISIIKKQMSSNIYIELICFFLYYKNYLAGG